MKIRIFILSCQVFFFWAVQAYTFTIINTTDLKIRVQVTTILGPRYAYNIEAKKSFVIDTGSWCPSQISATAFIGNRLASQTHRIKLDPAKNLCRGRTLGIYPGNNNDITIQVSP
ncbi:hypothetical protein KG892_01460 [Vermiphilus pyriformis]|uniref:Uncharacterized protein n=1 Tax=candidate division TM6 bacterium JCVI TM6SC1 TaxID=1306947 RepID=A0A0D2K5X2_9BACT|nr:hypothetical protein J120_01685 [candidate division TM6 bacterium JCVI TM6SC1]UNE35672.1 MAG: hypothetical protein KG892_01460 [Vermiphilus pyriformis]